jgi:hypothetical protein
MNIGQNHVQTKYQKQPMRNYMNKLKYYQWMKQLNKQILLSNRGLPTDSNK